MRRLILFFDRYATNFLRKFFSGGTIREQWQCCHGGSSSMNAGAQAEQFAADYLQRHGLRLIAKNYRSRFGEIDLILFDGNVLVFVEVRLRRNADFGGAAASIDARKQAKLITTAQQYLTTLPTVPPCRFDAILLDGSGHIEWLKNAFSA